MTTLLLTDSETTALIADLKAFGSMTADTNLSAGIATFTLCGDVVFKAIRKGAVGQPWIIRADRRLFTTSQLLKNTKMELHYAKLWTAGRNTQWANGNGDVATIYSYRTAALRDRAVAEYPTFDMEAVTAAEARKFEPEMMVLTKNADGEFFDKSAHYESTEIGDEFDGGITIIG